MFYLYWEKSESTESSQNILVCFSGGVINTVAKSMSENKGFFWFILPDNKPPLLQESGQELKAGTRKKELKQDPYSNAACWLASHGVLSSLSYRTQDYPPRSGMACSSLNLHMTISNQENAPETWPQTSFMEAVPQSRFTLPPVWQKWWHWNFMIIGYKVNIKN